jgi:sulfite exporter TauE/SafE
MIFKVLAIFIATLSGSVHCGAMCGGLSLTVGPNARLQVRYQFSRFFSYLVFGFMAGLLGSKFDPPNSMNIAALIAGSMVSIYLMASGFNLFREGRPLEGAGYFFPIFKRFHHHIIAISEPRDRALLFGLITPFLPCGWIFTAFLLSLNSGDPVFGGMVFFAVWLGSLPVLVAGPSLLRVGMSRVGGRGRKWVAIAMIFAGFFSLFHRFQMTRMLESSEGQSEMICR